MIELLDDGGVGYMSDKKHHGWVRIMFENWNSLGVCTQSRKFNRLNYFVKFLNIDIVAGLNASLTGQWLTMTVNSKVYLLLLLEEQKRA